MNPLYNAMVNSSQNNIFTQFQEFRKNFKGDPKQQVQKLLNSGKISQDQYNRAVQMANQFSQFFK